MNRLALSVALAAAAALAVQPGWAAEKGHARHTVAARCAPPSEAEQGIRYMTDLMVASSACGNTTYREFALRNRTMIIRYQNAMIARLHGKSAFDRWNTALANIAALRQSAIPLATYCQQVQPMLTQAKALDENGFHTLAATQAAAALKSGCTDRAQR